MILLSFLYAFGANFQPPRPIKTSKMPQRGIKNQKIPFSHLHSKNDTNKWPKVSQLAPQIPNDDQKNSLKSMLKISSQNKRKNLDAGLQNGLVFWRRGLVFWSRRLHFPPRAPDNSFASILNRFCIGFGSILDRFWIIFGTISDDFSATFRTTFHVFAVVLWPTDCKITSYFACLLLPNLALNSGYVAFAKSQPCLQNFRPHFALNFR